MSQVFRGLSEKDWRDKQPIGFTEWMRRHGYDYTWKMLIDELHVQAKLYGRDMENFNNRNLWFNKTVATAMANDYIKQLREDALGRPQHKCKGVAYVTVQHRHYFLTDIDKKLIDPLRKGIYAIAQATTPQALEDAVRNFWKAAPTSDWKYKQCAEWKDAFKGAGAYFTMQNLLRFHGCKFPKANDFYVRGKDGLAMLDAAAYAYRKEGWRLFGLMKQMIDENGIDIEAKRKEWNEAKRASINHNRR